MSHEHNLHPSNTASQENFLTTLRHELISPISIMLGYSSLLLEELKEAHSTRDLLVQKKLQQIYSSGQQLFSLIGTIIPPDEPASSMNLSQLSLTLQAELLPPLNTLIDYCKPLIDQTSPDQIPEITNDLVKIHAAAQSLRTLVESLEKQPL